MDPALARSLPQLQRSAEDRLRHMPMTSRPLNKKARRMVLGLFLLAAAFYIAIIVMTGLNH